MNTFFKIKALTVLAVVIVFSGSAMAINVTPTNDSSLLVNTILGSGITVSNITATIGGSAGSYAAGTFTGGLSSGIGIDQGIVLTSGNAALIGNTNTSDGAGVINGLLGDPDLNSLVPGFSTNDATILQFEFESAGGDVFFNYVFGSEEYNEFTNSQFNDVFGFFLDGSNIALIPGTTTPVSINNVNGGNPFGTGASNSGFFNNNDLSDGGPFFAFEYDGFTDVFTAQFLELSPGKHIIKLAIADAGDSILDSGVFIQASSFSDKPPTSVPEPATLVLLGLGLLGLSGYSRKRFLN